MTALPPDAAAADAAAAACTVSVIIPAYNVRPFLQRTLESALRQTLPHTEIIVVDDGSTDGTDAVCDAYAARHPRHLRVVHQANRGVSAARNRGLELARGEYVAFLDGDDYLADDFCELLYRAARASRAEICRASTVRCYPNGVTHDDNRMNDAIAALKSPLFFLYYMFSALYQRRFLEAHGLRFEEDIVLCEDNLFVNQAVLSCRRLALEGRARYYYCRRLGSADTALKLSHRQLQSVLYVYQRMSDNLNRCCGPADRRGVAYVYWNIIRNLRSIAGRTAEAEDGVRALRFAEVMTAKCPWPEDMRHIEQFMAAQKQDHGI